MKWFKLFVFLITITFSVSIYAQNLTVISAKKAYVNGEKVKKDQILSTEHITIKKELIVKDEFGNITSHGLTISNVTIDSLHKYQLKWSPINDSIKSLINCELVVTDAPYSTGPADACAFKYQIKILTAEDQMEFNKVHIKFDHLKDIVAEHSFDGIIYYLVISDENGLALKVFETPKNEITVDLTDLSSHLWLTATVRTVEPCGTSEPFPFYGSNKTQANNR